MAALVYAPWAYGCTTPGTIRNLNLILGAAAAFWLLSLFSSPEKQNAISRPGYRGIPATLLVLAVAILILGWWMALNAHWIYDSDFYVFIKRDHITSRAAGAVDAAISGASMVRATFLITTILLVADLARDPVWLLRLWWTVAATGASIALFGLIEKATGAEMIFWQRPFDEQPIGFFATYYYHGNAGAYLNLALPAAVGLLIRAFARSKARYSRTIAVVFCLLVLMAIAANTSRMAQVVAMSLVLFLGFHFRRNIFSARGNVNLPTLLFATAVLVLTVISIAGVSHLEQPINRWYQLTSHAHHDARWAASRAALRGVGDAGFFGFGPGTFRVVFPYYTAGLSENTAGVWRFLHEDYLQTLLEWGFIGATLLTLLFFGGLALAFINLRRRSHTLNWRPRQQLFLTMVVAGLAGIALHALVDFPFQIASLQLYVTVYLAVCWGSSSWVEPQDARRKGTL